MCVCMSTIQGTKRNMCVCACVCVRVYARRVQRGTHRPRDYEDRCIYILDAYTFHTHLHVYMCIYKIKGMTRMSECTREDGIYGLTGLMTMINAYVYGIHKRVCVCHS